MVKKYTIEYVRDYLKEYNYTLLSTEYKNSRVKLESLCPVEHVHEFELSKFIKGQRCIKCLADKRRYDISHVKEVYALNGFELLDFNYKSTNDKLLCKCPEGHVVEISLTKLKQGRKCGYCYKNKQYKFQVAKTIFESENYIVLANESDFKNSLSKLKVQCPRNHIIFSKLSTFKRGVRCRKCYEEDLHGEGHPLWIQDRETIEDNKRVRGLLQTWSKQIKDRDLVCKKCGSSENLEAHHIRSFNNHPELRHSLINDICLCVKCHRENTVSVHSIYGMNPSLENFIEFMGDKLSLSDTIDLRHHLEDKSND